MRVETKIVGMQINLRNLNLKRDYDRTKHLHYIHLGLLGVSMLIKWQIGVLGFFSLIFMLIALIVFYHFYLQTVKHIYYTFWTFSALLVFYLLSNMYSAIFVYSAPSLFYIHALALMFVAIEMYILSSPIYYPIVNWWEYDFRYRYDLKVRVRIPSEEWHEVRLTDLRRGAACVASFDEYEDGTVLEIETIIDEEEYLFKIEIMSKRQYSVGRPFHYGVKFFLPTAENKKRFRKFQNIWRRRKQEKTLLKFERVIPK